MKYTIPYGKTTVEFETKGRTVLFNGETTCLPATPDFKNDLLAALAAPIASLPLAELARGKKNILFLVEDNTRDTPLDLMLPIIADYLNAHGVPDANVSFMTAPGTHRVMTDEEVEKKLGPEIVRRFRVYQHDATKSEDIEDLGEIEVAGYKLPVHINRRALEADLLVGVGNIVPHSDAGFSGGAKIVQPGVCDFVTTQATHRGAGLCSDIPLGMESGNPCRMGIDAVGRMARLAFIINVVKNYNDEVTGFFCGDCIEAHRAGVAAAKDSYSVKIEEQADIVVASSSPDDIDFWQGIKGLTAAYFAVKPGGVIILAAPCSEGLVHNHPLYAHWLGSSEEEIKAAIEEASPYDMETDTISAVVALGSRRVLKRASVYMMSGGLSNEAIKAMDYIPVDSIQEALDVALAERPGATIGILPKAGISLPIVIKR
ncbi:MAG: nickel-dependent lactate racemase [Cloacibacillus sp.]